MRIALVTMPLFSASAAVDCPCRNSNRYFENHPLNGHRPEVRIHYINQDFAREFGVTEYVDLANSVTATVAGVGDWLFRGAAFPELTDNTEAFRKRYPQPIGLGCSRRSTAC